MQFPVYIPLGPWRVHPHFLFEALAYFLAFRVYLGMRRRFGDAIVHSTRWSVIAGAAVGAAVGSKLLYWLEDPAATWTHRADLVFLLGGKSIVGGLLGGLIAVELVKAFVGEKQSTGDLFAVPLCVGIVIGRIGCLLTGISDHTYGSPTTLPWGVDLGDGIARHPAPAYEMVYVLLLAAALWRWSQRPHVSGDIFRGFMVAYFGYRLAIDFMKPDPRLALGMSAIQWACIAGLLYYTRDVVRWTRPAEIAREAQVEAP